MMSARENLLSLLRRKGYEHVPVEFSLCPSLQETFHQQTGAKDYAEHFGFPWKSVSSLVPTVTDTSRFLRYYDQLKPGAEVDWTGVAHEPGSVHAKHMTYMRHPLEHANSVEQIREYPFPSYEGIGNDRQIADVLAIHARGLASYANMQVTIWETAWYIRGMENLMMDMMSGDPMAEALLDVVTREAVHRAKLYASSGVDILFLGDDVGMQSSLMMSRELYREWLKPRLAQVIAEARKIKPDILIFYHSCGYVTPLIPDLIEAGIDVLNPVQPECMDFAKIHADFAGALSFNGTLGTQSVMPFGTPEAVRREVFRNLDIAGKRGGLFVGPTHLLEPEVPWANVLAYVQACRDYTK